MNLFSIRMVGQRLLLGLGLLFSGLTLGSFLGQLHWTLDVLSHYHLQYTVVLSGCLVGLLLLRHRRGTLFVLMAALALNLYLVVPFFVPPAISTARAASAKPTLRVMALNISTATTGYGKVIALIRERQPDIVFMSEVRADLVALLQQELAASYPYLHAEPSRFTLGIALLSRQPFSKIATVSVGSADRMQRKYLRAGLDWQGQPVTLVGIHPLPPMNGRWAASRNYEIQLMGEIARAERQPFVLLGDLNASPWSQPMRQLLAQSSLRYAMQGYGVGLTWRLAGVLLGAPLDYVLVSPQWQVVDYVEGGDIGSDHIPIQADLELP